MQKRLYRSRTDQVIGGVCGGIAEYFGIDSVIVRLLAVLAVLVGGGGVLAYIIMWIIIPEKPRELDERERTDAEGSSRSYTYDMYDTEEAKGKDNKALFGLGLIGLGIYLAVDRFIPWDMGEYFWPAVLIVGGLVILLRGKGED